MSFDLQPILELELLGLRPLRPEDFMTLRYSFRSADLGTTSDQRPLQRGGVQRFSSRGAEMRWNVDRHRFHRQSGHRVVTIPRIRQQTNPDRNRLDVSGQIFLGRHQPRPSRNRSQNGPVHECPGRAHKQTGFAGDQTQGGLVSRPRSRSRYRR